MTGHVPRNYAPRSGSARATAEAAFRKFMAKPDRKTTDQSGGRNLKMDGSPRPMIQAVKKV